MRDLILQLSKSSIYSTKPVHHRVRLLYGEGLIIRRLGPGTEIAFYVRRYVPTAAPGPLEKREA